jgi:phosphohistidine phosphatase
MKMSFQIVSVMLFGLVCWIACGHDAAGESSFAEASEDKKTGVTKILYIVRHAKAIDTVGIEDFDRWLEPKGERNAKTVGEYLKRKNSMIDLVVISPSRRTQQTADIICSELKFDAANIRHDSSIYYCTLETYVDVIRNLDDKFNGVMVVGHNPATTGLANYLQKKENIQDVPTGGIVAIEFTANTWEEAVTNGGKLLYFHDPDDITDKTD